MAENRQEACEDGAKIKQMTLPPTSSVRPRGLRFALLALPVITLASYSGWIVWLGRESAPPSRCYGTAVSGRLMHGRRLPYSGVNFRAYSLLGYLSGRTFMHGSIRDAIISSYARVARERPELRYIYGESSWPWGGSIWPHRTHANGTAVDFFVPLRTRAGEVAEMPVSVLNKLGYEIAFDNTGRAGDLQIDFEAMALHLVALDQAAREHGLKIRRVIFDDNLQRHLSATEAGAKLSRRLPFLGKAWIRHDQHYHVDFSVACS